MIICIRNIYFFIFTNVRHKNKSKIVEILSGLTYKITYISAAIYHGLPNMVKIKVEIWLVDSMINTPMVSFAYS